MPYTNSNTFDGKENLRANPQAPYADFQDPHGPGPSGTAAGGTDNVRADGTHKFGGVTNPTDTASGGGSPLPHDTFKDGSV